MWLCSANIWHGVLAYFSYKIAVELCLSEEAWGVTVAMNVKGITHPIRSPRLLCWICNLETNNWCVSTLEGTFVDSSWNVMAHGNTHEGKWKGNWRMEWIASTLHTTSEHGVSTITTADAQTSAASSRLNWRLRRFKWTRPYCRETKSSFCACAITFQLASRALLSGSNGWF